jgi:ADP-ribose pyrophosphatase YjhB (NUDIX family)
MCEYTCCCFKSVAYPATQQEACHLSVRKQSMCSKALIPHRLYTLPHGHVQHDTHHTQASHTLPHGHVQHGTHHTQASHTLPHGHVQHGTHHTQASHILPHGHVQHGTRHTQASHTQLHGQTRQEGLMLYVQGWHFLYSVYTFYMYNISPPLVIFLGVAVR